MKQQYTLRHLALAITLTCISLALMVALRPEWRLLLGLAGVVSLICAACFSAAGETNRFATRSAVVAVSIASGAILWQGLHPAMYYMLGFSLVLMLWIGVLVGCLIIMIRSTHHSDRQALVRTKREQRAYVVIPLIATLLLAFQIPLRIGAAAAIPNLASEMIKRERATFSEKRFGIYTVQLPAKRRGGSADQLYFPLADGWESAFVYSPKGPGGIIYNEGSQGHLFGDWYWIAED